MKKLHFFACLFITALTVSCSSDDSGEETPGGENFQPSFEYVSAGTTLNITASQAVKSEISMQVVASDAEGNYIDFEFDKFGNLEQVTTSSTSNQPDMRSHRFYVNHYFNFEIIAIDEVNKTVKATYSGKVYEDDENLNSNFTEISGSFWVKYLDVEPFYPGLDVSATINGNDWHSTYSYLTNGEGGGFENLILHEIGADEYKIMLGFNGENMTSAIYTFTPASEAIYATVAKYNVETKEYEKFDATGALEITGTETFGVFTIVSGTYSFTAVNPNDSSETIQVTNGKFKVNYSW